MSEQIREENGEKVFTPSPDAALKNEREERAMNARIQRNTILKGIQNGTLSCLPGADGYATAEYLTGNMIEKASQKNPEIALLRGEKPVYIDWQQKNDHTGEWEYQKAGLFNVAQTTNPEALKTVFEQAKQESYQKWLEKKQLELPGFHPAPKQKQPGPVIECSSAEPEKYLGQYLAAVELGGKFKATPEQAAEFSKNLETMLNKTFTHNGKEYPDLNVLPKISNEACNVREEVKKELSIESRKAEYKQTQEQTQSQGRSR